MSDGSELQDEVEKDRASSMAIGARQAAVRLRAYYRAEGRGFLPGHEVEDWISAEKEVEERDAANLLRLNLQPGHEQ